MVDSQTTYIYALKDPRSKEIRYIGKTSYLKERYDAHIYDYDRINQHKSHWIDSLKGAGLQPEIEVLETVECHKWEEAERKWIKYAQEQGWPLTNIDSGGVSKFTEKDVLNYIPRDLLLPYVDNESEEERILNMEQEDVNRLAVNAIAPLAEEMKGVFSEGKNTASVNAGIAKNIHEILTVEIG